MVTKQRYQSVPSDVLETIQRLSRKNSHPTIVSISGGSSTCKSTQVLTQLLDEFSGMSETVQLDCMMGRIEREETLHSRYLWDHPDCYSLEEVREKISRLRDGSTIQLPIYDFEKQIETGKRLVIPQPIIVLDGMYANYGPLEGIADLSLYIESPMAVRLTRRSFRNMHERYRSSDPSRTIEGFFRSVLPAHQDFVVTQKETTDHVLELPYNFASTLTRFNCRTFPSPSLANCETWAKIGGAQILITDRPSPRIALVADNGNCYFNCTISKTCYQAIVESDPEDM